MTDNNASYTIHVVSHTHWDREWRYPFQIYRGMLIDAIDDLINVLNNNDNYAYFLFDSQTIILEDYLDIKPENKPVLEKFIREGKIHIGPWYTLPDTPEISGESIIRNLLMGSIITEKWEGKKWTGYSPFSFGQSNQIPQIYAGFDLDHIFFYRGNNDKITKNEFIWEGADGSRILGMRSINPYGRANWYVHVYRPLALNKWPFQWEYNWSEGQVPYHPCSLDDYTLDYWLLEGAHTKNIHSDNLVKALQEIKTHASRDATCSHLLYLDGMDQSSPYPRTPEIVELANKLNTGDTYIHSSFYDFVQSLKDSNPTLEVHKGEFRYPMVDGLWQNLFPGMLTARIHLKLLNRKNEILLQRFADTWSTLAGHIGMEHPTGLIEKAWKYLLANHAHDSIAGCSIDQVHEDVEYRFRQVTHLAKDIANRSCSYIVKNIDCSDLEESTICLVVFNATQYERTENIEAIIDIPSDEKEQFFTLKDDSGNELPLHFFEHAKGKPIVNHPLEFPLNFQTHRYHCLAQVPGVPPFGYKTFHIFPGNKRKRSNTTIALNNHIMENEYLRIHIQNDGRLNVLCKESGISYSGLHCFEDRSEVGDHATQRSTYTDEIISTEGASALISLLYRTEISTRYLIEISMLVPKNSLDNLTQRNTEKVPLVVRSEVTLHKCLPYLEIKTHIKNRVSDHKLRVLFPSGYKHASKAYAETHFGIIERDIILPDSRTWKEPMLPYYPQYRFCGVEGNDSGLAIFNIGLPEYAVHDDSERTIGLTLLRTFRFPVIGANPEEAETDPAQFQTQCHRDYDFHYAIFPYKGTYDSGRISEWADRFHIPLKPTQTGKSTGILPREHSFFRISPKTLLFSAIKKSARNENTIIRVFNPSKKEISGEISFSSNVLDAYNVKLNETRQSKAHHKENTVYVTAGPSKILTIEVTLEGNNRFTGHKF